MLLTSCLAHAGQLGGIAESGKQEQGKVQKFSGRRSPSCSTQYRTMLILASAFSLTFWVSAFHDKFLSIIILWKRRWETRDSWFPFMRRLNLRRYLRLNGRCTALSVEMSISLSVVYYTSLREALCNMICSARYNLPDVQMHMWFAYMLTRTRLGRMCGRSSITKVKGVGLNTAPCGTPA